MITINPIFILMAIGLGVTSIVVWILKQITHFERFDEQQDIDNKGKLMKPGAEGK